MGTVKDVIEIAKSQVGVKEYPFNSNSVIYNDWYYGRPVQGPDYPWCMVFVQWVFNRAKVPLPKRTASCRDLGQSAIAKGQYIDKRGPFLPGDVLLYSFNKRLTPTHTGIMVGYDKKKDRYIAIEGNTSNTNEANGGEVMKKYRKASNIVGAVRPKYDKEEKEDEKMDVSKLTDKEAYEILKKAMAYADTLPEPSWSIQNGSWKKAIDKKLFEVNSPEGILRRDQLTKVLQELGIL